MDKPTAIPHQLWSRGACHYGDTTLKGWVQSVILAERRTDWARNCDAGCNSGGDSPGLPWWDWDQPWPAAFEESSIPSCRWFAFSFGRAEWLFKPLIPRWCIHFRRHKSTKSQHGVTPVLSFSFLPTPTRPPPPAPTPCLFFSSLPGQFDNLGMQPECLSLLAWAGCETPAAHYSQRTKKPSCHR